MKTYLTYAPLALVLVWLSLAYHWYKSQRDFQKESGINPFSPFQAFKFMLDPNQNVIETEALSKLKRRSGKHMKIWLLSILIFIVVTFIVGIATANRK